MADSDSFVQEVTEEVRRDAMFAAWKKYGPFLVGAIAIVIIGTAAQSWWKNSQLDSVRDSGGKFIAAQSVEDPADAAEAFKALSTDGEGDYAAMAGLRAGASFGAAGDVERAVQEYEAVAAMAGVDPRLTDLAMLRTVMIRADTMEPSAMLDELASLSAPGEPWRSVALEFTAAAHVRAGDEEAAIEALSTLVNDEATTPAVAARTREMISALGGTPPEPIVPNAQLNNSAAASNADTIENEAQ